MPVPNYGVLKGRATDAQVQGPHGRPPHLHISLSADREQFDVAVNILSTDGSEILYQVNHAFTPPEPDGLLALPDGRTLLAPNHTLALDFVRQQLVQPQDMVKLAASDAKHLTESDLHNEIDDMVVRAINQPDARLFAFGSKFPEGIHDIHMNQGNPAGNFAGDNGRGQDGALFVYLPVDNRWLATFIAFQSQSWNNDGKGNPVA